VQLQGDRAACVTLTVDPKSKAALRRPSAQ
jgi:hypothetical protein